MAFSDMSDEEILAVVTPIMDNLMDASTHIDHARHTRDFTDRLKAIVTEDHLQKVCTRYQTEKGFFRKRKLLALLRRPDAVAVLWSLKYSKADGEFVAEALFVERDGRCLVEHTMIW